MAAQAVQCAHNNIIIVLAHERVKVAAMYNFTNQGRKRIHFRLRMHMHMREL